MVQYYMLMKQRLIMKAGLVRDWIKEEGPAGILEIFCF